MTSAATGPAAAAAAAAAASAAVAATSSTAAAAPAAVAAPSILGASAAAAPLPSARAPPNSSLPPWVGVRFLQFRVAAGRLALPLVATSLSIGASMFVGDVACQWLQFRQSRTALLAAHAARVAEATAAGLPAPPMPDADAALAYAPEPGAPAPRVPSLPASALSAAPRWWNPTRSLSMLCTGVLAGGPWQFSLARCAERLFPGRSVRAIACKMCVNMSTAPVGISSTFFLTSFFQGHGSAAAWGRIERDMPSTFVTGFVYWPFVSFVNLRFVELAWRPVVGSVAGAFWNVYVSAQANAPLPAADAPEGQEARDRMQADGGDTAVQIAIPVAQHAAAMIAAATMPAGAVALPANTHRPPP